MTYASTLSPSCSLVKHHSFIDMVFTLYKVSIEFSFDLITLIVINRQSQQTECCLSLYPCNIPVCLLGFFALCSWIPTLLGIIWSDNPLWPFVWSSKTEGLGWRYLKTSHYFWKTASVPFNSNNTWSKSHHVVLSINILMKWLEKIQDTCALEFTSLQIYT